MFKFINIYTIQKSTNRKIFNLMFVYNVCILESSGINSDLLKHFRSNLNIFPNYFSA